MNDKKIGLRIKKYRKRAGLTQKQLAEKCGCATGTIQQYELGKREPSIAQLTNIAYALNTSTSTLIDSAFDLLGSVSSDVPFIIDGVICPEIKNVREELKKYDDAPFCILTESERLLIYYNSLNDEGQEKAFELLELLLEIERYRKK